MTMHVVAIVDALHSTVYTTIEGPALYKNITQLAKAHISMLSFLTVSNHNNQNCAQ